MAFRSAPTWAELRAVFERPQFAARFEAVGLTPHLALAVIEADVHLVDCESPPSRSCADPDDDKFLALAEAADADYLITGDAALLELGCLGRTRIVTVAEFLDAVD